VGASHALALVGNTIYAWGYNAYGQDGNNSTTNVLTPTPVSGITGTIVQIAAGDYSSYALTSDGSLWVWGSNATGQLGLGDIADRYTPTQLLAPRGYRFTSISAGSSGNTTGTFALATASALLLGDANEDGKVDLSDLNIVLNNLGTTNSLWTAGNFDGAATIDLTDLNDVLNNLGVHANNGSIAAIASPVPEPSSLALLSLGAVTLLTRRNPLALVKKL
jgi:hypothetical protein